MQRCPETVKAFLEAPRAEALAALGRAWLPSTAFNELRQLPGLRFDGEWQNDPRRTRESILGFLAGLPAGTWWSLTAFTAAIKETAPDFQRPAGDYNSWFIRREGSEAAPARLRALGGDRRRAAALHDRRSAALAGGHGHCLQ